MLKLNKIAIALTLLGMTSAASAQIFEMSYTDTNGALQVKTPTATWYSANSNIVVTTIAGLDRKVKLELLKGAAVVQTETSGIITVANRITASGTDFYGVKFNVAKPASDGNYQLRSTVYDILGNQVSTNTYTFNVDTTPPTANPMTVNATGWERVNTGATWLLGTGGADTPNFVLPNLTDPSGIVSGSFLVFRENGSVYKNLDRPYETASSSLSYPMASSFPASNLDELFGLQFIATDGAGNIYKSPIQNARWDNVVNAPGVFGVYNPNSSNVLGPGLDKFDPYVAGMTVYTNPVKLAYRLPKTNFKDYVQSGIYLYSGVGGVVKAGEDATYVYLVMTSPHNFSDQNYLRWINFGSWAGAGVGYNLVLGPGVPKAPDLPNMEYLYSDIGWASRAREIQNSALPVTISQWRATVGARPFDQKVSHLAGCTIPAGQTQCGAAWNYTINKGTTGYFHDQAIVNSADGTLIGSPVWGEITWNDQHYPTISPEFDSVTKKLTLKIVQPGRGAYFDRLRLNDAWIENNGTKVTPTGGLTANLDTQYTYVYDLSTLAEGHYTLSAVAQERHGPKTSVSLFPFTSDRTPPSLSVKYRGGTVPSAIDTVKDLRVLISDTVDNNPVITRMTLVGGPINDALDLGYSKLADGWQPEVPRMFPTLEPGQEYTLKVDAVDAQGNKRTVSQTFSLSLQNLAIADPVKVMAVAKSLLDSHDQPLGMVVFKGALTDGGTQSRGPQAGYITLRSDAAFSVIFNGQPVQPGETREVVIPLDVDGSARLPVWPATSGVTGKASYMIDIPQLTVN